MLEAENILQLALAENTWKTLKSVLRRFLQFKENLQLRTSTTFSNKEALILWLTKKLVIDEISRATALQYSFDAAAALERTTEPLPTPRPQKLLDFRRAMLRTGAKKDSKAAFPISKGQLLDCLHRTKGELNLVIALCWLSATRFSDVCLSLRVCDCEKAKTFCVCS